MPCFEQETPAHRDAFLLRLSQYASHTKRFRFADYVEAINITEYWARESACYASYLQALLRPIYEQRSEGIAEAYRQWHSSSPEGKYQHELKIALCWEECFCHGNAMRAYKRACEATEDSEQQAFCLKAIAKIEHDMMTIY